MRRINFVGGNQRSYIITTSDRINYTEFLIKNNAALISLKVSLKRIKLITNASNKTPVDVALFQVRKNNAKSKTQSAIIYVLNKLKAKTAKIKADSKKRVKSKGG